MAATEPRTIVVGYDGSTSARAAVEHAARRLGEHDHLVIVQAYAEPHDYVGEPYYQRLMDDTTARVQGSLEALERDCPALSGVHYETDPVAGDPADTILTVARVRHADEIVVGSRGLGRFSTMALGSVAQKVIHGATCPVLVVSDRAAAVDTAAAARTATTA